MLILASQSPRRAELLRNAGYTFEVRPAEVDESIRPGESAGDYVRRLAREKALAALAGAPPGTLALGADTTVVVDGECLGKPADEAEARRMLARLSGRTHQVMTGVCVAWLSPANGVTSVALASDGAASVAANPTRAAAAAQALVEAEVTEVEFAPLSEAEIAAYVASGEPMDKAGAYAIQGRASRWIPRVRGCYFNVVGLPVARVSRMLEQAREAGR